MCQARKPSEVGNGWMLSCRYVVDEGEVRDRFTPSVIRQSSQAEVGDEIDGHVVQDERGYLPSQAGVLVTNKPTSKVDNASAD